MAGPKLLEAVLVEIRETVSWKQPSTRIILIDQLNTRLQAFILNCTDFTLVNHFRFVILAVNSRGLKRPGKL